MNYKDIMNAYLKIRKIDNTIPDEVLNFMKDTAIEKLQHKLEEPNCCAFCGKPTPFHDDKFCKEDCEFDYNEPQKPVTKRQAAIIKIAPNGDKSYHS